MINIQILVDNPNSWIVGYLPNLRVMLGELGHNVKVVHKIEEVQAGDLLFLLGCEKIFKNLHLNKHNLVVHESALPAGKGWSPLTWQVLEGNTRIPVTLFEATSQVDCGDIYGQIFIELTGAELVDELREKQFAATVDLILGFVKRYPNVKGRAQEGQGSYYSKRSPQDSKLDLNRTLGEQFNLLRVCDNERYPAWFEFMGEKYLIKIEKAIKS